MNSGIVVSGMLGEIHYRMANVSFPFRGPCVFQPLQYSKRVLPWPLQDPNGPDYVRAAFELINSKRTTQIQYARSLADYEYMVQCEIRQCSFPGRGSVVVA